MPNTRSYSSWIDQPDTAEDFNFMWNMKEIQSEAIHQVSSFCGHSSIDYFETGVTITSKQVSSDSQWDVDRKFSMHDFNITNAVNLMQGIAVLDASSSVYLSCFDVDQMWVESFRTTSNISSYGSTEITSFHTDWNEITSYDGPTSFFTISSAAPADIKNVVLSVVEDAEGTASSTAWSLSTDDGTTFETLNKNDLTQLVTQSSMAIVRCDFPVSGITVTNWGLVWDDGNYDQWAYSSVISNSQITEMWDDTIINSISTIRFLTDSDSGGTLVTPTSTTSFINFDYDLYDNEDNILSYSTDNVFITGTNFLCRLYYTSFSTPVGLEGQIKNMYYDGNYVFAMVSSTIYSLYPDGGIASFLGDGEGSFILSDTDPTISLEHQTGGLIIDETKGYDEEFIWTWVINSSQSYLCSQNIDIDGNVSSFMRPDTNWDPEYIYDATLSGDTMFICGYRQDAGNNHMSMIGQNIRTKEYISSIFMAGSDWGGAIGGVNISVLWDKHISSFISINTTDPTKWQEVDCESGLTKPLYQLKSSFNVIGEGFTVMTEGNNLTSPCTSFIYLGNYEDTGYLLVNEIKIDNQINSIIWDGTPRFKNRYYGGISFDSGTTFQSLNNADVSILSHDISYTGDDMIYKEEFATGTNFSMKYGYYWSERE